MFFKKFAYLYNGRFEDRQALRLVLLEECFFCHNQKRIKVSNLLEINELCNAFLACCQCVGLFFAHSYALCLTIFIDSISVTSLVFSNLPLPVLLFNFLSFGKNYRGIDYDK